MEKLLVGFIWIVGLTLAGCSERPTRSAIENSSATAVDQGDDSSPEVIADSVERADAELTMSSENRHAVAHFDAGFAAYEANDLALAHKEFLAAAKEGHADSQFNLAVMYEHGIGVGIDEKQAVDWYGKSAAQGNSPAQFNLGVLYENGRGTPVDFKKANEWYRKAAVQGDALAIGNLGMLYIRGQGVKENKVAGLALLIVSSTQDPSPENHARANIAGMRGLTNEIIAQAQALSEKLSGAQNLLAPLDEFLKAPDNISN